MYKLIGLAAMAAFITIAATANQATAASGMAGFRGGQGEGENPFAKDRRLEREQKLKAQGKCKEGKPCPIKKKVSKRKPAD